MNGIRKKEAGDLQASPDLTLTSSVTNLSEL